MNYETITISNPQDISNYVQNISCTPHFKNGINGASKTIGDNEGNSPSVALAQAYLLEILGYTPKVMSFVLSNNQSPRSMRFVSTAIYGDKDKVYTPGVATPKGLISAGRFAENESELSKMIGKELAGSGYEPKRTETVSLDKLSQDWRENTYPKYALHTLAGIPKVEPYN